MVRATFAEYAYRSRLDTTKLDRNLRQALDFLGIQGEVILSGSGSGGQVHRPQDRDALIRFASTGCGRGNPAVFVFSPAAFLDQPWQIADPVDAEEAGMIERCLGMIERPVSAARHHARRRPRPQAPV